MRHGEADLFDRQYRALGRVALGADVFDFGRLRRPGSASLRRDAIMAMITGDE